MEEIKYTRTEGQSLNESCPFNVMKYFSIRKAWQRLGDRGELQTLAITDRVSGQSSKVHVDRCTLEDIPTEGILHVHMTDLRVEDSGLYQCVIYQPPKDPVLLHHPIRLVVTKGEWPGAGRWSGRARLGGGRGCGDGTCRAVAQGFQQPVFLPEVPGLSFGPTVRKGFYVWDSSWVAESNLGCFYRKRGTVKGEW